MEVSTTKMKDQKKCPKCGKRQRFDLNGGGSKAVKYRHMQSRKNARLHANLYNNMGEAQADHFILDGGMQGVA
jgi:hypothetical protein